MTKGGGFKWYLEPKNSHTNEVISKSPGVSEENCHIGKVCADEESHNLWEVPSGVAFMLHRSRSDMKLKLRVWGQEGNGKIYDKTRWLSKEKGTGKKKKRRHSHAKF